MLVSCQGASSLGEGSEALQPCACRPELLPSQGPGWRRPVAAALTCGALNDCVWDAVLFGSGVSSRKLFS